MADFEEMTSCEASIEMLKKAEAEGQETAYSRVAQQKGCAFGEAGSCCRICAMGPCRINPKKPDESRGVCGATMDTIVARNFARMIAGGSSAHSDHGRAVAETLIMAAKGRDHRLPGQGSHQVAGGCGGPGYRSRRARD